MGYKKKPYTGIRKNIGQYVLMAARVPGIHETMEIRIPTLQDFCSQRGWTYTPVLMKVIAAVKEKYPIVNSFVARDITLRRKLFLADEVDVALAIEKSEGGVDFATIAVVTNVNSKSVDEISAEIRALSSMPYRQMPDSTVKRLLEFCPDFLKRFLMRLEVQFPYFYRRYHGTVAMSNLGKYGITTFDTLFINTFAYAIGGVELKVAWVDGRPTSVPVLHVTQTTNHLYVDGAESARVFSEFKRILESGEYMEICSGHPLAQAATSRR